MTSRNSKQSCFKGVRPHTGSSDYAGITVWCTGLSCAGKTTICEAVYRQLLADGFRVENLDADTLRTGLCRDLGFSKKDRDENVRRIGFIAKLLTRHNIIVLVSAISPYRAVRDEIRSAIGAFVEVYVDAPLEVCERRDVKGLYRRARAGLISDIAGIDAPYESPLAAEITCRTDRESVSQSADKIVNEILRRLGAVGGERP